MKSIAMRMINWIFDCVIEGSNLIVALVIIPWEVQAQLRARNQRDMIHNVDS